MKKVLPVFVILIVFFGFSQVSISANTHYSSSQLEIVAQNKRVLIPQVVLTPTSDYTIITRGNVENLFEYNTQTNADVTYGYYWHQGKCHRITLGEHIISNLETITTNSENIYQTGNVGVSDFLGEATKRLLVKQDLLSLNC